MVHRGSAPTRGSENSTSDVWEPIGPNGITATCIAVDPTNSNTIYVGGLSGLYKTSDGGIHWVLTGTQYINDMVYAIAIDPSNPATVFAQIAQNLIKSTDAGGTWTSVLFSYAMGPIFIDMTNPQIMITKGDSVYSSSDGGNHWLAISPFYNVSSIAVYPYNSNVIYAIGDSSSSTRLYKTTNRGQSWSVRSTHLPPALATYELGSLQVSTSDPNVLFAGNWSLSDTIGGFYRSVDGGVTWQKSNTGFSPSKSVAVLANDPLDANSLYAGGNVNGLYHSTNLGDSWSLISGAIPDQYASALFLASTGNIYCTFGGSIYTSSNQGSTWQSLNGDLQNLDVFGVVTDPTNASVLYVNSVGGIYQTQDGGRSWQQRNNGMVDNDVFGLALDPQNPSTLYAGTWGGLIYKTTDAGITWVEKSSGLPGLGKAFIAEVDIHPKNASWVWTSGESINFQSTDGGSDWSQFFINGQEVQEAVCDLKHPDTLYAIVGADTLLRSIDGGGHWSVRRVGSSLSKLTIDQSTPNTLYADSASVTAKSTNGGLTWSVADTVSPGNIYVNPDNSYYVYTSNFGHGVRRSTDAGLTWNDYNNGLPYLNTFTVRTAAGQSNKLYVSTFGGSVYGVDQTMNFVKVQKSIPLTFSLAQNFPNPFNPTTVITYQLPLTDYVTLKIYDVLGTEVATLVSEHQSAGNHSTTLNLSNLPSGVYFYSLREGSYSETKKLVLLK